MNGKHLFLTSAGLTDKMKEKFFDIIGKCPKDVKVLYIPTAGIETDGARESLAICFHELFLMGIQYENILVYNLELILSKDYQRTYSSYVTTPFMLTRLLTFEELNQFDAVLSVVVMYLCFVVKCLELVLIEYLIMQLKRTYICRNQCRKYVCGGKFNRWITYY